MEANMANAGTENPSLFVRKWDVFTDKNPDTMENKTQAQDNRCIYIKGGQSKRHK